MSHLCQLSSSDVALIDAISKDTGYYIAALRHLAEQEKRISNQTTTPHSFAAEVLAELIERIEAEMAGAAS